ncbi:MAG: hypothetical protein ACNA7M_14560 [Roseovarius sp.]
MPYPENIPSINDMLNLPTGELAQLPVQLLAALQGELDRAGKQLKAASAKFSSALDVRYATRAAEARRACGKDTGTIRIVDGDYTVIADLPKRVDWDQDKLAVMVERIRTAKDKPEQYVDIIIKVPERKYTAWPDAIREGFEPARTVRPGTLKVTLEPNGDAA